MTRANSGLSGAVTHSANFFRLSASGESGSKPKFEGTETLTESTPPAETFSPNSNGLPLTSK